MPTIYLADITAHTGAEAVTLRFGTDAFVSRPDDEPPNTAWLPHISDPGNVEFSMFGDRQTGGAARVGFGALELLNTDGSLDEIVDYGFDGRALTIRAVEEGQPLSTAVTLLSATMDQAEASIDRIIIRIRDRLSELDAQVSQTRYAGTNVLPEGEEGTTDIRGRRKPIVFGKVLNIEPVLVNSSRLIYQVSTRAFDWIEVYDRGAKIPVNGAYSSLAELRSIAPPPGTYRAWTQGGMFRLGAAPTGQVTADVTDDSAQLPGHALREIAQTAQPGTQITTETGDVLMAEGVLNFADGAELIVDDTGISVSWADVYALNGKNGHALGIYIEDQTGLEAMSAIAESVGAWYGFGLDGNLHMGRLEAPGSVASIELGEIEIESINRETSRDTSSGLPVWRVTVDYQRHYTVQSSDIAGSVAPARRAELGREYRNAVAENASVRTKHKLAPEMSRRTCLDFDAQAEAYRLLTLYSVRRTVYRISARLTNEQLAALQLGAIVRVTWPRFGLDAGKTFVLIGAVREFESSSAQLTLWG